MVGSNSNSSQAAEIPAEPVGLRRRCWFIFLFTMLLFLIPSPVGPGHFLLIKSRAESWNDQARIATVESLVEQGTLAIERTKWGWFTGDHVFLREHFYSTKPPLLSAVGAVSYWILRKAVHLITGNELTYIRNEDIIYPWVTYTTSVFSFALLLVFFLRALFLVEMSPNTRNWLFWSLAAGTLYPAYTTVFNNHTIAGAWMFIGFYYVLRYRLGGIFRWWEAIFSGLALGFAGVNDFTGSLPFMVLIYCLLAFHETVNSGRENRNRHQRGTIAVVTVFAIASILAFSPKIGSGIIAGLLLGSVLIAFINAVFLLFRKKPSTILCLIGLMIPVLIHLWLNSRVTGNFIPTYIQSDVYIATPPGYFGEVISAEEAGILFWARWKYIGTALFGIRGIFLYTPVLLIGLLAVIADVLRKKHHLKLEAVIILLTVLCGWGWVLLFGSPNFGGTSFGFRYAIPATPLLIFWSYRILQNKNPLVGTIYRSAFVWGLFVALVAIPYPWGIFGQLPPTQNSLVGNLEYIAMNILIALSQ